jgi:glycosyltransferase involved in cell wall biosynthesis
MAMRDPRGLRPAASIAPVSLHRTSSDPGRTIRTLMVAARFFPDVGGTETHTRELACRLTKRDDIELTLLTTDRSGERLPSEEFEGFTVLRCRAYPRARDYYIAPGIYTKIRDGDFELIHCQGIHTAVPILAMMAARSRQIPYVVTLHTGGHSSSIRRKFRTAQWRVLGPLLRSASAVVAVSRFEQRIFQQECSIDASRFRIIRNGGDLPALPKQTTSVPGRIVSSGRLEQYKGHQRLIEALPYVQRALPEATLSILGSGPYESHLRALVKALELENSVTIDCIGPGDRERMADSLGRAALVASMSDYESHPVAIMEALALGVPAVGLDTAGLADLVEEGLIEGVPKEASPEAIAQILLTVLGGRRVKATALPTWDAAAASLAQIYLETAGFAPRPPTPGIRSARA